jgi:hypothetical protein
VEEEEEKVEMVHKQIKMVILEVLEVAVEVQVFLIMEDLEVQQHQVKVMQVEQVINRHQQVEVIQVMVEQEVEEVLHKLVEMELLIQQEILVEQELLIVLQEQHTLMLQVEKVVQTTTKMLTIMVNFMAMVEVEIVEMVLTE